MADWDKMASAVKKEEEEEKPDGEAGLQKVMPSPVLHMPADQQACADPSRAGKHRLILGSCLDVCAL